MTDGSSCKPQAGIGSVSAALIEATSIRAPTSGNDADARPSKAADGNGVLTVTGIPHMEADFVELEKQGWRALATAGDAGKSFYASILRSNAVMLLPGGIRIEGRENILQSFGSQPWESFQIEEA
jgi:hypothetical protein